jgi:phosphatidylglycerol:prolipoprotein diacylglycerol transferase
MWQTLFHVPHEILGLPVFGLGWALLAWTVFSAAWMVWLARRQGWNSDTLSYLPVMAIIALAIVFLLPRLEEQPAGQPPLGLPIRGYGTLLLAAVVAGVGLCVYQARRVGLDVEIIYSLAFWMFLGGIAGARAFHVVEYWELYAHSDPLAMLWGVLNVAAGGLVVYGALFGGLAAAVIYFAIRRMPPLPIADVVIPGMALGLAIGRVGCLLNGCCFGGACELPWAVTFPQGTFPYIHQQDHGLFHGFRLTADEDENAIVQWVEAESPAAGAGLASGDRIEAIDHVPLRGQFDQAGRPERPIDVAAAALRRGGGQIEITTSDGRLVRWPVGPPPPRSRPVHPTQVYSAVNALLLCLLLLAWYPYRRHDGEVFALGITLYAVTRFILEIIRVDEAPIFGTGLSISQNVSLVMLVLAAGLWVYILRQPRREETPPGRPGVSSAAAAAS